MPNLEFNIKANFDQISEARKEMNRLREELQKTTKATDPIVIQDLTDRYAEQRSKVAELSSAMARYANVMSSDYSKKMQNLTREVYSFELQADASKRKLESISQEMAKMQATLRKGGLDVGTKSVTSRDLKELSDVYNDEKRRYNNLTGLGEQSYKELQNMQSEYAKYSGSTSAAADNVKLMTNALSGMVEEMKKVPTVGEGASDLFSRLGGDAKQLAMSLVGGLGLEQLAQHIFNVRSEFQQLEISFNTMLGSEQKAGALMSQLIDTAKITPFNMSSITEGAKQLLAYGIQANEVNETLIHLGDIASGLNIPLGQLVYLYGTTIAQGRMYTMDLRQFMGRGVPMAEELGKIMGKTTQDVQQAITDGKVGANLVKKAIYNMSAEGGKFGGLMEKQSLTLQGRWSNIEDSVDQMFNEMGKKSEGVFGYGLDQIAALVDNWETVIKVIGTAVVAVGTYKASLMAAASIQKAQNSATLDAITANLNAQIENYKSLTKGYRESTGKNTGEYKKQRVQELNSVVGDTHMIGNKQTEELVALKIKQAQTDGIITEQMAEQLQLKRDMLVAQQQSTANDAAEAAALSKGLDEKMSQFKEMENDYRQLNGKDTKEYKASRYAELGNALMDTENIGDDGTEERISKQIELARSEGLISEEMAKQLQLKRDLLVEQAKIAEKEQMQYQNSVNEKESVAEKLRVEQEREREISIMNEEDALKKRIASANETELGKAMLKTHEMEKQANLQQSICDKARDEAFAKKENLVNIDEQIKKQKELVEQMEADIVNDNGSGDATAFGGYEDGFSDRENNSFDQYNEEMAKLDELMLKRSQAVDEFESAKEKYTSARAEMAKADEMFKKAAEEEYEIYKESDDAVTEINDAVQTGIDIQEGKTTVTEQATLAVDANTKSENTNTTAKNSNATATDNETRSTNTNTITDQANTASNNTNTTSENINTGAKQKNSFATTMLTLGTKLSTAANALWKFSVDAVTMSLKGLWTAMLANPITAILTLVTTAISMFSMFADDTEDVADKTKNMSNKASEASNRVRALFASLGNDAKKSKQTISELASAYEEYGVKLDETIMKGNDEAAKLEEVKKHREELIGVIEEQTLAMEHQNNIQAVYDKYKADKDNAKSDFAKDTSSTLTTTQANIATTLIQDDDLIKLNEARKTSVQEYYKVNKELVEKIVQYYKNLGLSAAQIDRLRMATSDYINDAAKARQEMEDGIDTENKAFDAANKASDASNNLTDAQRRQAAMNRASKKSFKELNGEIQDTINKCSQKCNLKIKVNYDDSELPKWIKNMSQSQLKSSIALRQDWLEHAKPGDVLKIGKYYKTYEQVLNELAMMQARGNNETNKLVESEKEKEKKRKAAEKAKRKAEREQNDRETREGNTRNAKENYDKTISSYSEKAVEDYSTRKIKLIDDNYEKERQSIEANYEKQKKTIEDGIDKLVEAKKKEEQTIWVNAKKGRKASMWKQTKTDEEYRNEVFGETMKDSKGNEIKDENGKVKTISDSVSERNKAIAEQEGKDLKTLEVKRLQSMYDYLKEYGSIQEQRYAISKEYDDKIAAETDAWKKKQLEAERTSALAGADAKNLAQGINWSASFQGVGNVLKDIAKDTLSKVNDYMKKDEFKQLPASDKKAYIDLRDSLVKESSNNFSPFNNALWNEIEKNVKTYQDSVKKVQTASDVHSKAVEEMEKAEKEYNKNKTNENKTKLNKAKANVTTTKANLDNANNEKSDAEQDLTDNTNKAADGLNNFQVLLGNITSGSLKGFATGVGQLISSLSGGSSKVGDALQGLGGKIGGLIGAILSIIEALGEDPAGFISSLLDKIAKVIETILSQLPQIILNVIKGVGDIVGGILKGAGNLLTFGLFSNIGDGNAAKVNKAINNLTKENERLTTAIESLRGEIKKEGGIKAIEAANKALEYQNKVNENNAEKVNQRLGYHSAHHSFSYYWENGASLTEKEKQRMGEAMGLGNAWNGDLHNLTPDQAKAIIQDFDVTEKIRKTGKGGYGNEVLKYIQEMAEGAETTQELIDELNESVTQISFDSLKSDFISSLMDMNKSAKDFSNDFSKMLMQAVLSAQISNMMDKELKEFYEDWSKRAQANGGKLTKTDVAELKKKWQGFVEEGVQYRDELADITGYKESYSQSSSTGAFESMSQDTADELNGRFTAVQIATEGTYQVVQEINQKLSAMLGLDTEGIEPAKDKPQQEQVANISTDEANTMLALANEYRKLNGEETLESESGLNTEEITKMIGESVNIGELIPDLQSILPTFDSNDTTSFVNANIGMLTQGMGQIYVAMDEGRTILAQSLMCLQSIDDRQEKWHKPMLQLFRDVSTMKDKINTL